MLTNIVIVILMLVLVFGLGYYVTGKMDSFFQSRDKKDDPEEDKDHPPYD